MLHADPRGHEGYHKKCDNDDLSRMTAARWRQKNRSQPEQPNTATDVAEERSQGAGWRPNPARMSLFGQVGR